jgi:hypothetical protein
VKDLDDFLALSWRRDHSQYGLDHLLPQTADTLNAFDGHRQNLIQPVVVIATVVPVVIASGKKRECAIQASVWRGNVRAFHEACDSPFAGVPPSYWRTSCNLLLTIAIAGRGFEKIKSMVVSTKRYFGCSSTTSRVYRRTKCHGLVLPDENVLVWAIWRE